MADIGATRTQSGAQTDEPGELVHVGPYAIVPAWVYSHPDLNDSARTVYGVLATFANVERCAWPSRALIGERCGKDVGTVGRALKVLTDAGVLVVERRKWADSGLQRASVYRLAMTDPRADNPGRDVDDPGRDIANIRGAISRKSEARIRAPKNKTIRTKPEEQNTRVSCGNVAQISLLSVDDVGGLTPTVNVLDRFQEFYDAYGRKVGRAEAINEWKRAIKKVPAETIIEAATKWRAAFDASGSDPCYIPHPSRWLKREQWADELPRPKVGARQTTRAPIVERTDESMNMRFVDGKLVPA